MTQGKDDNEAGRKKDKPETANLSARENENSLLKKAIPPHRQAQPRPLHPILLLLDSPTVTILSGHSDILVRTLSENPSCCFLLGLQRFRPVCSYYLR